MQSTTQTIQPRELQSSAEAFAGENLVLCVQTWKVQPRTNFTWFQIHVLASYTAPSIVISVESRPTDEQLVWGKCYRVSVIATGRIRGKGELRDPLITAYAIEQRGRTQPSGSVGS